MKLDLEFLVIVFCKLSPAQGLKYYLIFHEKLKDKLPGAVEVQGTVWVRHLEVKRIMRIDVL